MLGQRRRRWANIKPALVQCLAFAERALQGAGAQMQGASSQLGQRR